MTFISHRAFHMCRVLCTSILLWGIYTKSCSLFCSSSKSVLGWSYWLQEALSTMASIRQHRSTHRHREKEVQALSQILARRQSHLDKWPPWYILLKCSLGWGNVANGSPFHCKQMFTAFIDAGTTAGPVIEQDGILLQNKYWFLRHWLRFAWKLVKYSGYIIKCHPCVPCRSLTYCCKYWHSVTSCVSMKRRKAYRFCRAKRCWNFMCWNVSKIFASFKCILKPSNAQLADTNICQYKHVCIHCPHQDMLEAFTDCIRHMHHNSCISFLISAWC